MKMPRTWRGAGQAAHFRLGANVYARRSSAAAQRKEQTDSSTVPTLKIEIAKVLMSQLRLRPDGHRVTEGGMAAPSAECVRRSLGPGRALDTQYKKTRCPAQRSIGGAPLTSRSLINVDARRSAGPPVSAMD